MEREIAFYIGPLAIHWYGIMLTLGVISTLTVAAIEARRLGENPERVLSVALIVIPLGIIGARLYHVIDQLDFYLKNPAATIGGAGLGIFGAVIGGAVGIIIYTKWKKLVTLRWMDIVAPGLILAQAIGRWGNFFNQELYGYPTDLPWAIYIDPAHRLPGYEAFSHYTLFFYESMWNLIGFALLMILGRKLKNHLLDGDIFFGYAIYYCLGRFFLEMLKPNVWTIGSVPTAQWVCGFTVIALVAIVFYRRYRLRRVD